MHSGPIYWIINPSRTEKKIPYNFFFFWTWPDFQNGRHRIKTRRTTKIHLQRRNSKLRIITRMANNSKPINVQNKIIVMNFGFILLDWRHLSAFDCFWIWSKLKITSDATSLFLPIIWSLICTGEESQFISMKPKFLSTTGSWIPKLLPITFLLKFNNKILF